MGESTFMKAYNGLGETETFTPLSSVVGRDRQRRNEFINTKARRSSRHAPANRPGLVSWTLILERHV